MFEGFSKHNYFLKFLQLALNNIFKASCNCLHDCDLKCSSTHDLKIYVVPAILPMRVVYSKCWRFDSVKSSSSWDCFLVPPSLNDLCSFRFARFRPQTFVQHSNTNRAWLRRAVRSRDRKWHAGLGRQTLRSASPSIFSLFNWCCGNHPLRREADRLYYSFG
jgi:hypothetical protein